MVTRRRNNRLARKRSYGRKRKAEGADKYGEFDNGRQRTPDRIAGHTLWYPREEET